ncbi:DUF2381 family protein [Melittangium boletus]|uniref:DUF2381 family protein n=1 Tax=Melittangium boletus DSM 14713 TaxID=1294270 RepID=A0A250IDG5_9BACT|nr:DUF2381 family protein [Melittangium boletus]ATB29191.1 hypothetical protein MEBOL_002640 [Melittangium boletus DSM 14713]
MGTTAAAQPQSLVRERQERQVVAPGGPSEPVPEVRVATHIATTLVFNAPIDKASVEVEGRATRFRLVDVGERIVFLEPLVPPGEGERLGLRVRYKDGASPASATFALVSHPSAVDTRVDVVRSHRSPEVLEAALAQCEAGGPASLVLSGRLGVGGVGARRIQIVEGVQAGLQLQKGTGFRADSWAMVSVRVHNLPGQQPWTAGEARLTRADGTPVKVLSVRMDRARLAAGETGWVVVETEPPSWARDEVFRVELGEKGGERRLVIGKAVL